MKIKRKKLFNILIISSIILSSWGYILLTNSPNSVFYLNVFLTLLIIKQAKISFFSLFSIVFLYPQISFFIQYNTNASYGVLQLMVNTGMQRLYYSEAQIYGAIFLITFLIYITFTDILELEKIKLKEKFYISDSAVILISFIAVTSTIICFPNIPFTVNHEGRFWQNSLLPGSAWNHVALISILILSISRFKDSLISKVTVIFVIFIFLSNFERVDMMGFFAAISIYWIVNNREKITRFRVLVTSVPLFFVVLLNVFVGEYRSGVANITFSRLISKLVTQNTATDIAYLFNSTIDYISNGFNEYHKYYFYYLVNILPGLDRIFPVTSAGSVINSVYNGPGGEHILIQPLLDFGVIGIPILSLFMLMALHFILSRKSKYFFLLYIFYIAGAFRIGWYGISYIETGTFVILPILYFLCNRIMESKKKKLYLEKEL